MKSFVCVAHLDGCEPSVSVIQAQSHEQAEALMQKFVAQNAIDDGCEDPDVYVDSVNEVSALRESAAVAKDYSGEKKDNDLYCLVYASTDDGVELMPVYATSPGRASAMYRNRSEFLSANQTLGSLLSASTALAA